MSSLSLEVHPDLEVWMRKEFPERWAEFEKLRAEARSGKSASHEAASRRLARMVSAWEATHGASDLPLFAGAAQSGPGIAPEKYVLWSGSRIGFDVAIVKDGEADVPDVPTFRVSEIVKLVDLPSAEKQFRVAALAKKVLPGSRVVSARVDDEAKSS